MDNISLNRIPLIRDLTKRNYDAYEDEILDTAKLLVSHYGWGEFKAVQIMGISYSTANALIVDRPNYKFRWPTIRNLNDFFLYLHDNNITLEKSLFDGKKYFGDFLDEY